MYEGEEEVEVPSVSPTETKDGVIEKKDLVIAVP